MPEVSANVPIGSMHVRDVLQLVAVRREARRRIRRPCSASSAARRCDVVRGLDAAEQDVALQAARRACRARRGPAAATARRRAPRCGSAPASARADRVAAFGQVAERRAGQLARARAASAAQVRERRMALRERAEQHRCAASRRRAACAIARCASVGCALATSARDRLPARLLPLAARGRSSDREPADRTCRAPFAAR